MFEEFLARKSGYREHQEQCAFVQWCQYRFSAIPELALLYAVPNGDRRDIKVATRLKGEGVRAGVSDMCLPVPRGPWHGLYLEFKSQRGRLSHKQSEFSELLLEVGYLVVLVFSCTDAIEAVTAYLEQEKPAVLHPNTLVSKEYRKHITQYKGIDLRLPELLPILERWNKVSEEVQTRHQTARKQRGIRQGYSPTGLRKSRGDRRF